MTGYKGEPTISDPCDKGQIMPPKFHCYLLLSVCLFFSPTRQSVGDEPSPPSKETQKYRQLVQQLASPNKQPKTQNRSDSAVRFPEGYDKKAQQRVAVARNTLHDNLEAALPALVEGLDDHRYSMTIDWADGDAYYNRSVGTICRSIIESNLEVYRDKMSFTGPSHWNAYRYKVISEEWYRTRQGRTLAELQIEAIDWAIKKRMEESPEDIQDSRKNEVANLQKLRDEIAKTNKPAKPQRLAPMVTSNHGRYDSSEGAK